MKEQMTNPYSGPQHIVCLTAETAETLYLLGEGERIVGMSGVNCEPLESLQPSEPLNLDFTL